MEKDGGMSSARRWMEILNGSGGAVMRCRKVAKIVVHGSLMSQGESCRLAWAVVSASSCPSARLCEKALKMKVPRSSVCLDGRIKFKYVGAVNQ